MKKFIWITLLLMLISIGCQAAQNVEKVWLVAIGVSKYNQSFHPLPRCADTAKAFADAVRKARPLTTEVFLLTTDAEDDNLQPTSVNVLRVLDRLKTRVKNNDLVLLYFGGHGVEQNSQQYLLTRDADLSTPDLVQRSTISLADLRKRIDSLNTNGRLLILDACRETVESLKASGGVGGSAAVTKDFLVAGAGWSTSQEKASGTFFGCQEGQKVYHNQEGSFFGKALVEGMSGKAKDEQGQVTVKSLADYVAKAVPEAVSREFGGNTSQKPTVKGQNIGAVVLKPSPGFVAIPAFDGEFGEVFAKAVQTYIGESGEVNLVNRMNIASAIKELKLQESGMTDTANAQKLGKFLNAKYVLAGSSVKEPGNKLNVSVQLVVVQTGQVVPGISAEQSIDPDNWKPGIQALSNDLLVKMRGDDAAPVNKADTDVLVSLKKQEPDKKAAPPAPKDDEESTASSSEGSGSSYDESSGEDTTGSDEEVSEPDPASKPKTTEKPKTTTKPSSKGTSKPATPAKPTNPKDKFNPVGRWLGYDTMTGNNTIVVFLPNNTGTITRYDGSIFPFKWKYDGKKNPAWLDYTVYVGYLSQDFKCLVKVESDNKFTILVSEDERPEEWDDGPGANLSQMTRMN